MLRVQLISLLSIICLLNCAISSSSGLSCNNSSSKTIPIVLWHGLGPDSSADLRQLIHNTVGQDVYIKSIQLAGNGFEDTEMTILLHPNVQISTVCQQISDDEELKDGFHAIGLSQGAQFLRGLIQRCASAKVINFISLGGQHQGIYGVPLCDERSHLPCQLLRLLLNYFAYTSWVQKHIAQATYWHDPLHEQRYRLKSSFLADINNEKQMNKNYVRRLHSLNKFVMVKFTRDSIVTPLETSWFGFYQPLSTSIVLPLVELIETSGDKLELRRMMDAGKIEFIEVDSGHVEFSKLWFVEQIVPYLKCKF